MLTLRINSEVLKKATIVALKNNTTVYRLIEIYLKHLDTKKEFDIPWLIKMSSLESPAMKNKKNFLD